MVPEVLRESSKQKTFYKELDIIKGIAILLVILGHSFSRQPINIGDALPSFGAFVREFQMPLFFLASGFLWRPLQGRVDYGKKVRRLLIPYLSFSIILSVVRFAIKGESAKLLIISVLTGGVLVSLLVVVNNDSV